MYYHKYLKKIAKAIGANNELAISLFYSGIYKARILCGRISNPKRNTDELMGKWAETFENLLFILTIIPLSSINKKGNLFYSFEICLLAPPLFINNYKISSQGFFLLSNRIYISSH